MSEFKVSTDISASYSDTGSVIRMRWRSTPVAPMFSRNGIWTASFPVAPPQPDSGHDGAFRGMPRVWTTIAVPWKPILTEPCPIG
jgi:hypothetical protein